MQSFAAVRILAGAAVLAMAASAGSPPASRAATPVTVTIDYPEDGSIFPPEITPPTFLWRDSAKTAASWRIEVTFADGSPALHALTKGPPLAIGRIDPDCVADTNKPPKLTPEEAAGHSWAPGPAMWAAIKKHSVEGAATVTISGYRGPGPGAPVSRGSVRITTSRDPAGAPIFYRDVPLMPSETERGVIKPLAQSAIPLVAWRLRNLAEPRSRVVMSNMPVCANCHSFSADGKTMGMDLDGLQNNRGLYFLANVKPRMSVANQNLIQWSTPKGVLKGSARIGFMSQVSPDGRYVVTTIDPIEAEGKTDTSNYYVANFKDYRFLQVFYPTRGVLSWYSKATGVLRPLPGANDPRYVQMGAVWSPDAQYLVFARAEATDANPPGVPVAQFANDPHELPMKYDLYRIPFRDGKGGTPEPIEGASHDGMSNSFPKVSPDGRWIVFVKARNGLLMRPDSQLYIVPAAGGVARRMNCNTRLMNSWHSFSPNGRWLVFSSKARSPYTQMYLTHIDENGNDSPAILVENSTAANRAVNLPEFVNIPPDGIESIGGPALEFFRWVNRAVYFQKRGRLAESVAMWRRAAKLKPDNAFTQRNLGTALLMTGHRDEAGPHLQKAEELSLRAAVADHPGDASAYRRLGRMLVQQGQPQQALPQLRKAAALDPASAAAHSDLAAALLASRQVDQALAEARKALSLDPKFAPAHYTLGLVLSREGEMDDAIWQWREALKFDPQYPEAHDTLAAALYARGNAAEALAQWRQGTNSPATLRQRAWILATSPVRSLRNGREAMALAVRASELSAGKDAAAWDTLAAAYAEAGRFEDAVLTEKRALALAQEQKRADLAGAIESRMQLFQAKKPFRDE